MTTEQSAALKAVETEAEELLEELDELAGGEEEDGGKAEPLDLDDDDFDDLQLEEDTVGDAYDFVAEDEAVAGKWFPFPNLGPDVEVRVAKFGNPRFLEAMAQAKKKWGAKKDNKKRGVKVGDIPPEKQAEVLSLVYAKTIWLGFRGAVYFGGKPLGGRVTDRAGNVLATFTTDDDGRCADTLLNRRTLLRKTWSRLADDLFDICNEDSNYAAETEVEEVRGN